MPAFVFSRVSYHFGDGRLNPSEGLFRGQLRQLPCGRALLVGLTLAL